MKEDTYKLKLDGEEADKLALKVISFHLKMIKKDIKEGDFTDMPKLLAFEKVKTYLGG
jgi:hypothetical protein